MAALHAWGACLFLFGALAFAGCTQSSAPAGGITGVRLERTIGGNYRVGRAASGSDYFIVTTVGGRPGTKAGAAAAVIKAFGCQRVSLRETEQNWRRAEGRGSFCRGNPYYRR